MSTQSYNGQPDQASATMARKDWRQIYAQRHANSRIYKAGRIHEDVNEAAHIWRAEIETVTIPGSVDKAKIPTVATPTVSHRASPPTEASSGAWATWPRPYWMWDRGIAGTKYDARVMVEHSTYLAGVDFSGAVVNRSFEEPGHAYTSIKDMKIGNNNTVSRFAFARGSHHRTPSTSTASSGSLKTECNEDWWKENSPWGSQWAESKSQ
ncbi:hypothetical protein C8Q72DRAFT_890336 [Fomitopsis betulina]|nr:hypothetical protein C8Q72DRAFT_890336 [Fomitopsis betulina]